MILNQNKRHLLVSGSNITCAVIDGDLNFDEYVFDLCKKAGTKLSRLSDCMSSENIKMLLKAFVESQFGYCLLIWMFHGRKSNSDMNNIHERALRLVY